MFLHLIRFIYMNLDTNPRPALHPLGAPVVQQWPRIRGKATLSIVGANTALNFEKKKTSGLNSMHPP